MKNFIFFSLILISMYAHGQRVIKNGDTYLKAHFGDATFDSLAYFDHAEFDSGAYFLYAKFNSKADFGGATFGSTALFRDTKFNSEADFRGATFDSLAYFDHAEFDSLAYFFYAKFNSKADFEFATFGSEAYFGATIFNSQAYFGDATFGSVAYFGDATFGSEAYFGSSTFGSEAYFGPTIFNSQADFEFATFDSLAYFEFAIFGSVADFRGATFRDDVNFNFTELPDTLNFNDVKTNKIIDFTSCENRIDTLKPISSENVCVIFLARTDLSKIRLNYTDFKLAFDEDSISKKGIANTYESLLETQKQFPEGYKKLDIEYKEFKYLQKGLKGKIYKFFDRWWWNYGHNKEKVIWNTLIILVLFSIMNWFLFEYLNQKVYKIEKVWSNYLESKEGLRRNGITSRIRKMINILPYSFYYTSLIFFGFKMNTDNINYRNHIGLFYLVFLYLVGIVDLLFIANFVFTG